MKKLATLLFLAFLTTLYCSSLRADWPCRTDSNVTICAAPGNQWNVHAASDGNSGAFFVWQDRRNGLEDKLYMQHVNSAGVPQWTADGIPLVASGGYQYYPQIISDGSGGAFVVWQDNRNTVDYDIYIQRVSSLGNPLWVQNGTVVCNATGNQYNPQLVADGVGGVIVTWQDRRSGQFDIYAQHFNASGQVLWQANGVAVSTAPGDQIQPVITTDGAAGAVIAWSDYRAGTGFSDIYAQRVIANGQKPWSVDGILICGATNTQWNVQIAADGVGSAYIVWQDRRAGTYDNIYAQLISNLGLSSWAADGIPLAPVTGVQYYPQVVADGAGGIVVVWQDNRKGADYDIYGQRVNHSGQLQWLGGGQPICIAAGHQYNPQVVCQNSSVFVTWQDRRDSVDFDIYAQALNLNGNVKWDVNGVPVCSWTQDQFGPQLATDNQSGAIVAWSDYHTSLNSTDIYSQRIGANGKPAGGCYRTISQYAFGLKGVRTYNRVKHTVSMPNEGNVRDTVFKHGVFANGLYLGYPRLDSPRLYAWEIFTGSLYIRYALPQNGTPRPLSEIYGRTLYGALHNPSVHRYNNLLSGELLTLKLNIAASDVGITEPNLGELIFKDPSNSSNPLNNKSLRQIAAFTDSTMTYWRLFTKGLDYAALASWLGKINLAFNAPLDTVSLSPLKLTKVLPAFSVPFLAANPAPPPVIPSFQPIADVVDQEPQSFELFQNYPNPFNPMTTIEFTTAEEVYVSLKVFNVLGQEIKTLIDHQLADPGRQVVDFNGSALPSGVYFYRLSQEDMNGFVTTQTKKMMLLK